MRWFWSKVKKKKIIREQLPFSFFSIRLSLFSYPAPPLFPREPRLVRTSVCVPTVLHCFLSAWLRTRFMWCQFAGVHLPPTSFFLISKPSYFTHVTICNLRSSRAAVFHSARPGARQSISAILVSTWKRRALPSAPLIQQTDSKAVHTGKWVRRRRSVPYLLFPSVTHTERFWRKGRTLWGVWDCRVAKSQTIRKQLLTELVEVKKGDSSLDPIPQFTARLTFLWHWWLRIFILS